MMHILLILVYFVIKIALITTLVAMSLPSWSAIDRTTTETITVNTHTYTGLWSTCTWKEVYGSNSLSCDSYLSSNVQYDGSVKAVQAMMILGGICGAAAFVVMILKCCILNDNKLLGKVIAGLCIGAAVFLLVGAIVWGTAVKDAQNFDASDLHAGFGLSICAAVLFLTAGIVMLFVKD